MTRPQRGERIPRAAVLVSTYCNKEAEKQLADMEEREEDEKQQREFDEAMRKAQRQSRAIESKLGMVAAEQTLVAAE